MEDFSGTVPVVSAHPVIEEDEVPDVPDNAWAFTQNLSNSSLQHKDPLLCQALFKVKLTSDTVTIGRHQSNTIVLAHPGISGVHLTIKRNFDKPTTFELYDNSTNGTWLNERRIPRHSTISCSFGQIITLLRIPTDQDTMDTLSFCLISTTDDDKLKGGHYVIRRTLGTGAYADVKLAIVLRTNHQFAIKMIDRKKMKAQEQEGGLDLLLREVRILTGLNHHGFVKVHDHFHHQNFFCIVLDYMPGGDLLDHILKINAPVSENEARDIFVQLVEAMEYLHKQDVVHRDIKPENVLLDCRESQLFASAETDGRQLSAQERRALLLDGLEIDLTLLNSCRLALGIPPASAKKSSPTTATPSPHADDNVQHVVEPQSTDAAATASSVPTNSESISTIDHNNKNVVDDSNQQPNNDPNTIQNAQSINTIPNDAKAAPNELPLLPAVPSAPSDSLPAQTTKNDPAVPISEHNVEPPAPAQNANAKNHPNALSFTQSDCFRVYRESTNDRLFMSDQLRQEFAMQPSLGPSGMRVKLTDFGLSKSTQDGRFTTVCGTPQYLAPEVLSRWTNKPMKSFYGKEVDLWSLGVILFILVTFRTPFGDDESLNQSVMSGNYNQRLLANCSAEVNDIIKKLLRVDPAERMTMEELIHHPWLADVYTARRREIEDHINEMTELYYEQQAARDAALAAALAAASSSSSTVAAPSTSKRTSASTIQQSASPSPPRPAIRRNLPADDDQSHLSATPAKKRQRQ